MTVRGFLASLPTRDANMLRKREEQEMTRQLERSNDRGFLEFSANRTKRVRAARDSSSTHILRVTRKAIGLFDQKRH